MWFALQIDSNHSIPQMSRGLAEFKGLCDLRMSAAPNFKLFLLFFSDVFGRL